MALISKFREGFSKGYTSVTREEDEAGVDFGIYKMLKGETVSEAHAKETVWVLMEGSAEIEFAGFKGPVNRKSLFDEAPTAISLPAGSEIKIKATSDTEWTVSRATNEKKFVAKIYRPEDLKPEYRGKGLVQDASMRNVRLIFDTVDRPESNMVVGEVVNFPGRWSSYPPHHHAQPEIYHYRFTLPQGYGHGEDGEEVFKIKPNDTLVITGGKDHCQVSAPGYGMYYLWIVRHLPGNQYKGFEYSPEHMWLLDPKNQGWVPKI